MKKRCTWVEGQPQIYLDYHDQEWGRAQHDDQALFEQLTLEGAQAGLSWLTILKRREGYRRAFAGFNVSKVARFSAVQKKALLKNEGIIRNRLKIEATVENAKAFRAVQKEFGSFDKYIWSFVGGKSIRHPKKNGGVERSVAMSKDLKKRGFRFVGPTICYAFMQATGMLADHSPDCFKYRRRS